MVTLLFKNPSIVPALMINVYLQKIYVFFVLIVIFLIIFWNSILWL
jgi:hypothetical protein